MAEALWQAGHDIHVVTYHLGDRSAPLPFNVHRIRNVPGYTDCRPGPTLRKLVQLDPLLTGTLKRLLRHQEFDLIHAHHYEGLIAALISRAGLPVVYDAHTLLASELPYYRLGLTRNMKEFLGRQLDLRLPAQADHIIAVSESIREAFVASGRIEDDRVSVIPNGVEAEHFAKTAPGISPPAAHGRLVFAGNLAPYQGIELLLQSFARVRRRLDTATLSLLTDSDFTPYESLAGRLGIRAAIEITNPDYNALPACLQRAEVLLNPRPPCEGIPQKLLNYMAAGRPIVSFAGSAKIIEHGHTALVVPDDDVNAFAEAILHLLQEPSLCRRLGGNAQGLVASQYGWAQVAVKITAVYRRVLAAQRRAANA